MSPAYPKQNWPRSETAKSDLYFSSLIFCPEPLPGKMWLCRWFTPESPSVAKKTLSLKVLEIVGLAEKSGNKLQPLIRRSAAAGGHRPAIVTDPAIILADEPTGNLDTFSGQAVMDLFDKFNRQGKPSSLLLTKNQLPNTPEERLRLWME